MYRWIFRAKRLSRTVKIDFEAVEDIINSISADKEQYSVYLQSYIQNYLQSSKQISKQALISILNWST